MTEILNLLPTVPAAISANLPASARYIAFYPNRRKSIHGIRPANLFVFEVNGEGDFLVEDGQITPCLPCGRCGGYGEYSFNSMDGSMCYGCYGAGTGKPIEWTDAERIAKRRTADKARAEKKRIAALLDSAYAFNALFDEAADVIAWLSDKTDRNGFIGDVARKLRDNSTLSERQIAAIRKIIAQDAEKKESAKAAGHFGEIGKRVEVEVQIVSIKAIESQFGESLLLTMKTREGHTLKSFASSSWAYAQEVSPAFVNVKLTPKAHEEYNGEPQTMVSRVAAAK
jgi:hypothetical protein